MVEAVHLMGTTLPNEVTLDDFEHLSVWCVAAGVSFGDGRLKSGGE